MDVTFIVSVSVFFIFILLILAATVNYFTRIPESASVLELRGKTKSLFDIFFGSGGIATNERVTTDLYRIPLLLQETNGTARTNEIVSVSASFSDLCDNLVSWNNTVRVYDQNFVELPSRISYQELCSSQWLNTSFVTFIANISANENKRVYIYSINNSNTTAPNHNLFTNGYWKFDEASGTLAKDSSGYQNNGTLTNFDFTPSSGWYNGTSCKYGSCLKFDGVNDFVNVSTVRFPDLTSNYWSVSAWVNISSVQTLQGGIWAIDGSHILWQVNSTDVDFFWGGVLIDSVNFPANQWINFIVTRNGSTFSLYTNGTLTGTATSTNTASNTGFLIGTQTGSGYYLNGTIDDVRIYNKTLTTSEIASIANATLLTVKSFPTESVTAVVASKVQNLNSRNYPELKSVLGGDYDFRIEIREK